GFLPPALKIELSLPDARYQKNKKKIKISVDGKVKWTDKWTKPEAFAPPFEGRDLHIPLSSTVQISLFGKHCIRNHLVGSYSGRAIDFVINKGKPLTLQDCGYGACATVTMGLSPV
ncbi:hypothetical protein PAXRUDRAFT_81815, partial [Paxillus rubicundulus Ve08.2h10]